MDPKALVKDYSTDKCLMWKITVWLGAEGDYVCHWRCNMHQQTALTCFM